MKQKVLLFFCALFIFLGVAVSAWAQDNTAKVVDFPVKLNQTELLDIMPYTEYPLLMYHDITYFPMTWYNCRMLGLETDWTEQNGLTIKQNNALASSVGYYPREQQNPKQVQVTVPNFKITVNGQVINNQKEEYPLLNFRNVTYFPLTWRFAHDAFGWDYSYTKMNGLQITSHNPQIIYFPALAWRDLQTPIKLLDNGCYYYLETDHKSTGTDEVRICRAPVDNSFRKQVLYTFSEPPATVMFALLDEVPHVFYQMKKDGLQQILQINKDGTVQAVKLDLQQYTNGSSNGDKQNGWQYAIRNQQLCSSEDGGNWKTISQTTADWFGILDGQVYYLHRTPNGIGVLYQVNGAGQDKRILKENVDAVAIQDGYLLCQMNPEEDYGAKILDSKGNLVLAITGRVDSISASAGIVMASTYGSEGNEYLKVIRLDETV